MDGNTRGWKGVIIAEGLDDPTLIKGFTVFKVAISQPNRPIDTQGTLGRRHYYWITGTEDDREQVVETLERHTLPGWYAHLWDDQAITAIFHNRVFHLDRHDRRTWQEASAHGRAQGITDKELDFLTD
jgi:hypothetical protein